MKYIIQNSDNSYGCMEVLTSIPLLGDGLTIIGKAEDHPEIVAVMEATENKAKLVQAAYDLMNKEVLDQMFIVFGTTKPESATANQQTWQLMKDKSALFVPSKFATEAEVIAFADAKITAVEAYAVWREQRIDQFRILRQSIINS